MIGAGAEWRFKADLIGLCWKFHPFAFSDFRGWTIPFSFIL